MNSWIIVLSAWLTPTVALVGLLFAGLQCWLAFKKRKDDLFDRRWDFYCRAKKQFLEEFIDFVEDKEVNILAKHVRNYVNHYADEAFFLFGSDIEKHVRSFPGMIVKKTDKNIIEDPVQSFRHPFEKYLKR